MREVLYTNVQRFSLHDGGGIRTVVFLKGCPFSCPWCCNPETLSFSPSEEWHGRLCVGCSMVGEPCASHCARSAEECPTGAKEVVGRPADVDGLLALVSRDRVFYEESDGGVTLSGGECLAGSNQAFSLAFLEACKDVGLSCAVETTLAVRLADVARLASCCDRLLVDFKVAERGRSLRLLGLDTDLRDANLHELLSQGVEVVARMPIVPGFTDDEANVWANVQRICELGIPRVDVLPFHQLGLSKYEALGRAYGLRHAGQLSEADVAWVVAACERAGLATTVHGA